MAGHVYCFSTVADANVIKCGHTQQALDRRLRSYLGPSKPRMLIFGRTVEDSVFAEQIMLVLMRQCRSLKSRSDLGNEWFEIVGDMPEALKHLAEIANVVRLVHAPPGTAPVKLSITTQGPAPQAQVLASLRKYLTCMDAYVRTVAAPAAFSSAETLMRSVDASPACPVFASYLPYGEARLDVIRERYKVALRASG
jgi:hypothetical protein